MLEESTRRDVLAGRLLRILAIFGILVAAVVGFLNFAADHPDPDKRAIVAMGLGLMVVWCGLGGLTMRLSRDRFVGWSHRLKIGWRLRFVLLGIAMAMLEEAVTTSLTNAAPFLGAATDAARITRSTNYFEVISGSVVAFIPWFLCWAWLLGRYDFRPNEVMLLFGLTGTMAETLTFGSANLLGIGMWVFVYGLMVYLPVHTIPRKRDVAPVRWYHCPVAVFLPLVFIIPFAIFGIIALAKRVASLIWRPRATSPALLPRKGD